MKQTFRTVFLTFCLLIGLSAQQVDIYQRPEHFERSHNYDACHYCLEFRFDLKSKIYWGKNTITLEPLRDGFDTCVLDAMDFTVTAVQDLSGRPLRFEHGAEKLLVRLDRAYNYREKVQFVVEFQEQNPKTGMRFIDKGPENPAQINTYAWPENARYWFPCYDFPNDKVTNELIATVPPEWKVLSNGRLVEERETKEGRTFHWQQDKPHATYLIMMAAGPYVVIKDSLGELPVNYWVYKNHVSDAMRTFKKTPSMIDFYSRTFNVAYPWAKYDQVLVAGSGGGMEDTSATVLGHGTIHDARAEQDFSSEGLVAHELAHQWWGDLITERTWSHVWLSESFATFCEYLFSCHDQGEGEGAVNLLEKKNSYLREARTRYIRPLVFNHYRSPWDIMDSHSYPKGAVILNMLRFVMGDRPFFRSMEHFLKKHSFQSVGTYDLMTAIKEATGQNLDWFFEQWIFSPGHPKFEVDYAWKAKSGFLTLHVKQVQDTSRGIPVYRLPVVMEIVTSKEQISRKVWIEKEEETFTFEVIDRPLMVRFDKGNHLLKEWTFPKRLEELIYQLGNDDIIGRMWAAGELAAAAGDSAAETALQTAAVKDAFWSVREKAVEVLGGWENNGYIALFKQCSRDQNSRVRVAALRALAGLARPGLAAFFKQRFERDDSYRAQAEALRAIGACGSERDLTFLHRAAKTPSPRRIIQRAAENAIKVLEAKISQDHPFP